MLLRRMGSERERSSQMLNRERSEWYIWCFEILLTALYLHSMVRASNCMGFEIQS